MIINKLSNNNFYYTQQNSTKKTVNSDYKSVSFSGIASPNPIKIFLKQLLRKRRKPIYLKTPEGTTIKALLIKPKPFDWYMMKDNKKCLGMVWLSKTKADILGDAIPSYYQNNYYLFINSIESNKTFKGIGTQLIKAVVEESQRLGLEGRVCLNTSTTNPQLGTPVPFYHKLGFKSVNNLIENKIDKYMAENKPIPSECEATTMYLPKEKALELLSTN